MATIRTSRDAQSSGPTDTTSLHGYPMPGFEVTDANVLRFGAQSTASGRVRILLADRSDLIRAGVRAIVDSVENWEVIAEATTQKDTTLKAAALKPDVVILDTAIDEAPITRTIRRIRTDSPQSEILVTSIKEHNADGRSLLQAGARGFILKSDNREAFLYAINALATHKHFFSAGISEILLDSFLSEHVAQPPNALSARERIVVQLIAEGHSNREISAILNRSQKTVESHRASAMHKLKLTSTAALVRYAVRAGLVEA